MIDHASRKFLTRRRKPVIKFVITFVQDYLYLRSRGYCVSQAFKHAKDQH